MSTTTIHGQMSKVDANGNVQILHQETSASDVLVNNSTNTQGTSGGSALPSGVDTLQKLTDKLAALAFKKNITTSEFAAGVVANDYTATAAGKVLDARRGKDLNDRLTQMEDEELLVIGIDTEDTSLVIPESIINDDVVSGSQVWSSEKVNSLVSQLLEETHVFYVPLVEGSNGKWTAQKTVAEIEAAYNENHPIWVVSSEVLLPLTQRVSQTMWVFSGYTDGRAYDITVSSTGVTIEDKPVASLNDALPNPSALKLTGAVQATYDGSNEVVVAIPEAESEINDNVTGTDTTWSSTKISEVISDVQSDASNATAAVSTHNSATDAHTDIRQSITQLNNWVTNILNSTEKDLDQTAEIVAYIKNNKSLIDGITTGKVNVSDIINTLTSTATNKPLSAAQGKALKDLIDALDTELDSHTHKYAGSSTAGGSANSAVKLDSSDGSATQPVYFKDGKPVATTYSLGASVPSDAKFTDTVYTLPTAGSALGGVKTGGDVTITDGVITVNDDSHAHVISNIDGLQSALDGKAASSHGTHVEFSTTKPVMDGTASVGSANTVARSDHKHPTDTTRASKADLDTLTENVTEIEGYLSDAISHASDKNNPHGVTLSQLSVNASATELNHVKGVTSAIQTQLDGKAPSSHGTHVEFSTTTPVVDGTASAGSANTVARSDHKHPTDTSRAAASDLTSHTDNTTVHITAAERTNWTAAKTHADSAHAPSNAEKNQNAFSNIKVGSTTIAADTTTDTVEFVGSNVTITPDATNDKVTFAVADGTTGAKGVVQLTDSTSSTSTTTAATPNSVKSAYDLANTAKTNADTAKSTADSAASTANAANTAAAEAKTIANGKAPAYTYGKTDLTAGSSPLAAGTLYFVYE